VFWSTGHGEHERRISWEHAVPLEGDLPMTGSLGAEDPRLADDTRYELYAVAGDAGEEIGILLSSSDFDAFLYLYDSERQIIATDDDSGGGADAYLRVVLPADGVYYVLANAFRPDGEGDYRLELRTLEPIDWARAVSLTVPDRVEGTLSADDPLLADGAHYDVYSVDADPGAVVSIELVSAEFDAYLWVYDDDGTLVGASDDVAGTDAGLLYASRAEDVYRVLVSSFSGGERGRYELRLSTGLDPEWGEAIAVGQERTGALERTDRVWIDGASFDLYLLAGQPGQPVSIALRSQAFDAYLVLLDDRQEPIAEDDDGDGGSDARIEITLPGEGPYFVVASSYDVGERGAYSLSVTTGSGAGAAIDLSRAQIVAIGEDVGGVLSSSDPMWDDGTYYDLVAFDGRLGDELEILLMSEAFDAYLELYGPDGAVLGRDDDSGAGSDALLHVTLPADGRYTVFVNSYFGGEQGEYVLRILRREEG
ncbi:MAG: PPC domain-containing protein, partial [Candidatus Bipolaricaulota bacterium]